MIFFQSVTQAYSEKEIPSSPNRSRTYDLPITSSDALRFTLKYFLKGQSFILLPFQGGNTMRKVRTLKNEPAGVGLP